MKRGKRQRVYVNVYKRWKERKRGSQSLRKFVVGPFAVGNEINTPSFDKKKEKKATGIKERKEKKRSVFQRQFHSIVVNVESILLLRNSSATPIVLICQVRPPTLPPPHITPFLRPSFIRVSVSQPDVRPFPTSAIPLPQISLAYNDTFTPRSYSHANSRESFPPLSSLSLPSPFPSSNFIELN